MRLGALVRLVDDAVRSHEPDDHRQRTEPTSRSAGNPVGCRSSVATVIGAPASWRKRSSQRRR